MVISKYVFFFPNLELDPTVDHLTTSSTSQISITDSGPKIMTLGTATSNGFKTFDIRVRLLHSSPTLLLIASTQSMLTGHLYAI